MPDTTEPVTAFKGFNPDLTCRDFQFAEGATVEHDGPVSLCSSGFYATLAPLDVLSHYPPATSVYRVVELEDVSPQREGDSKVVARKLTVGASLNLVGLAQAHVEYVTERVDKSKRPTLVGYSAASNTGSRSAASNTGDYSAASRVGYGSAASNTGSRSAASNTGDYSAASNTGDYSAASSTGDYSAASNTGYGSAASVEGEESIAIVTGRESRAAGAKGCWIVLTERDAEWHILEVKAVKVGTKPNGTRGLTVKPGVFYTLRDGKVIEAEVTS